MPAKHGRPGQAERQGDGKEIPNLSNGNRRTQPTLQAIIAAIEATDEWREAEQRAGTRLALLPTLGLAACVFGLVAWAAATLVLTAFHVAGM